MVEAMCERSPAYFKKFYENFRSFASEEKRFSMFRDVQELRCLHAFFENGYCEVLSSTHYLV